MEHDEKCELSRIRASFEQNNVFFTDFEMALLRNETGYCWCISRALGRNEPTYADLKKMGRTAFNYILSSRQQQVLRAEGKDLSVGDEVLVGKIETGSIRLEERPDAQIIRIDFKQRRRID